MKAIAYYRVSSESQRDNTSLENQKDQIGWYAKTRSIEVVAEFNDVATGSNTSRKGFKDCMSFLEENQVDAFMVYKYDRAHRNLRETLNFVYDLEKRGVSYISVTQNIDTSTPQGKLFFQMICSFAEFEREVIRERCREGRKAKARKKEPMGGRPPIGYDKDWKIVPDEVELVKGLFIAYLREESLERVRQHYPDFTRQALHVILTNRAYLGEYRYDGDKEHTGVHWKQHHPAIISPSIFGRVQKALARNRRNVPAMAL